MWIVSTWVASADERRPRRFSNIPNWPGSKPVSLPTTNLLPDWVRTALDASDWTWAPNEKPIKCIFAGFEPASKSLT